MRLLATWLSRRSLGIRRSESATLIGSFAVDFGDASAVQPKMNVEEVCNEQSGLGALADVRVIADAAKLYGKPEGFGADRIDHAAAPWAWLSLAAILRSKA